MNEMNQTSISAKDIQFVQDQTNATAEEAAFALEKTNGDIPEAIAFLWNIPAAPTKPKTEWDERRDICRAYEEEMEQYVRKVSKPMEASGAGDVVRSIPFPSADGKGYKDPDGLK